MKNALITILILWAIAYASVLFLVHDANTVLMISPVFAVCMIGTAVTLRRNT
jgi:hypothetical protein